jgi:hypothetical protein
MKTITIKDEFKQDYISREAGERLRNIIIDSLNDVESIIIDFSGVTIASTSFFDEGFAKLKLLNWNKDDFNRKVQIINMNKKDYEVLILVCKNRRLF